MQAGSVARWFVLPVIGSALVTSASVADSWAGEYAVASCKADSGRYSTDAFAASASPGTRVVRACDPHGAGLRGLITKNVSGVGQVPAGSRAAAVITAPPGTRFKSLVWAGSLDRRDCRFALQLYADGPGFVVDADRDQERRTRTARGIESSGRGYRARPST